jgi:hypothetical protein
MEHQTTLDMALKMKEMAVYIIQNPSFVQYLKAHKILSDEDMVELELAVKMIETGMD